MIQRYAVEQLRSIRHRNQEAYRVPWQVDRRSAPTFRLINKSDDVLRGVSLSIIGAAVMKAPAPQRVPPGGSVLVGVHGRDLARNTVLVVRLFRADGDEYLWNVSF